MEIAPLSAWVQALGAVTAVSAVSLVGAFLLTLRPKTLDDNLHVLVAFAVGALFGDAFIHLLPEAFAHAQAHADGDGHGHGLQVSLLVLGGIVLFMVLERLILWRHQARTLGESSEEHGHAHEPSHGHGAHRHRHGHGHHHGHSHGVKGSNRRAAAILNLVGDGVHNLVDGLVIGASFTVSPTLGLTTTLAVLLHEIPQELGDFGILVNGGLSHGKALGFNALSALCAIVGAVLSLLLGPNLSGYSEAMLPVTAGGFIYIAGSTLIPDILSHVQPKYFLKEFAALLAGIGIMVVLALFE
jgi:zinc transporter ZupT